MGCGASENNAVGSGEGKTEIRNRQAPFEVALRVCGAFLEGSYVQRGVDDCTLVENSVVVSPLPDKYLLGDPYLGGCKPHPRSGPHGVDHVGEKLLEVIVEAGDGGCGGVENGIAGDPDGANSHVLDFSRGFREDSGLSRDTRETGNAVG